MAIDVTGQDLDALAARVRAWLEDNLPPHWRRAALDGDRHALARIARDETTVRAWHAELGRSGLATPTWPAEHGGLGLAADAAAVVGDELARLSAGRPESDFVGVALAGPTIIEWGTAEQRDRFLRPLALGEHRWCQLFSEPGAGSDLASLATRAERVVPGGVGGRPLTGRPTGDGNWVVDGQKVWSSFSDSADFGLLMARTDPSLPKRRGITYFLLDMRSPGVEVRPLRQLNGHAEFGEVFLDGVVVPDSDRLGPEGSGWAVALTTLMQERSGLSGRPGVGPGRADRIAKRARRTGAWEDPVLRDEVMRAFVAERALQMATVRAFAALGRGEPGAEGSIRKLAYAQLDTSLGLLETKAEPGGAIAWGAIAGDGAASENAEPDAAAASEAFLSSKIYSIAGGTSEIQRNIIGERVLGLPRDKDPYADLPFSERPRG
ncbi:acyl-CoA dehydrogenase [Actinomadura sp. KC345]|uniref:acyl-CoA dehydrogenase family protein n=1 Tax=Actinomadura sp. KC345 TaxID=2530371 RepID=UPI001046EEB8|nr:acyl-CoA dehydrogenase family protein [Actinomadura sp. KC345]TDC44787.1 acyl-CoA dehydrogenase [Actinomadura sp. KC345]